MKVTDKITITNEDNMLLMARYPDNYFDFAIVDPPYGIDIAKWDTKNHIPNEVYFNELFRVSKEQLIFGANYFNLPHTQGWLCWDKTFSEAVRNKSISQSKIKKENISEFELIWTSFLKKSHFIRFTNLGNLQGFNDNLKVDYDKPKKIHITEKPIDLYKFILDKYAKQGYKILDTHLGSGSIAIACHDYGFDLTACELDKEYYDKAIQRIQNHVAQQKLF
jgi:site-specific DNA-methyltransferase (adenine-specific)